ncbi:MAG: UDP-2,3-diacylglucosamine diphosphatase LpxI, partial [Pseudomonadota bacterium]
MTQGWQKLGILAGGGGLPVAVVKACEAIGTPYHLVKLKGYADENLEPYDGDLCQLAELGKIIKSLKDNNCDAVVLVGNVSRPNFSQIRPDWQGAKLLPKIIKAARHGDGALLEVLVAYFTEEGFQVIGADDVAAPLKAPQGKIGEYSPSPEDMEDMQKASQLVAALGPFDVGQGAVVRDGYVIAIEAAEGTDKMLERCLHLFTDHIEDQPDAPKGVLLK